MPSSVSPAPTTTPFIRISYSVPAISTGRSWTFSIALETTSGVRSSSASPHRPVWFSTTSRSVSPTAIREAFSVASGPNKSVSISRRSTDSVGPIGRPARPTSASVDITERSSLLMWVIHHAGILLLSKVAVVSMASRPGPMPTFRSVPRATATSLRKTV
ncbi:hypothetical protein BRD14_08170 [Halobacteriales archaeon SW_5_68_122]|nr:MAG: hypothetical protein BRD14_08170 [Halobacteriales archaeon SW_5_68_122]